MTKIDEKATTLKGLQYLPEPLKAMLYDDQALFNILSDNNKINKLRDIIKESKETWGSPNIFHTTELINCLTKAVYMRFPPEGFTQEMLLPSLKTHYYFFRGNLFDLIFSLAMPNSQVDFKIAVEPSDSFLKDHPEMATVAFKDISIVGRADWLDIKENASNSVSGASGGIVEAVNDLKTVKNLYYINKQGMKRDHFIQTAVYSWVFGAKKIRIYYLDLGDLIVKEINTEDIEEEREAIIEKLKERALLLYYHVSNKLPYLPNGKPEIDYENDKENAWRCSPSWCPFTAKCWPNHPDLKGSN